jgi:hypothetical protein
LKDRTDLPEEFKAAMIDAILHGWVRYLPANVSGQDDTYALTEEGARVRL